MSANPLGAKKTRQLSKLTGLEIDRAWVWNDGRIAYARIGNGPDHRHVKIDRRTGEVEEDDEDVHFTSCRISRDS